MEAIEKLMNASRSAANVVFILPLLLSGRSSSALRGEAGLRGSLKMRRR